MWFIIVNPRPFVALYKKHGFLESEKPGYYYHSKAIPPIRIIVINELDPKDSANYLLMLLSSGTTFQKFLRFLLSRDSLEDYMQKYLKVKFVIESRELSTMAEVREMEKKYTFEENIRYAVEEIGIEKVVASVGIEKVLDAVGIEKVLDAVGIEKVLGAVGIEKVLDVIDLNSLEDALKRKRNKTE